MSAQTAKQWLLKIAAEVEQDPTRWTRRALFRNALGVKPDLHTDAVCWCTLGFICREELADASFCDESIRSALKTAGKTNSILAYNDSLSTAAEFIAWFRRAAELCE